MLPSSPEPLLAGGWREGDPPAGRRFADLGPMEFEFGGGLPAVRLAYETFGTARTDADGSITNAVLILHALTGDAHVVGPAGPGQPTPGWWEGLVGPDAALDPERWFIVAANVLGGCQGSTGPSSLAPDGRPWGSRFGRISVRDQVRAEVLLADQLRIERFAAVIGGSMGGMRALEWVIGHPGRVGSALVLASTAVTSADQVGVQSVQLEAIRSDPGWRGGDYHAGPGPVAGLGLARRMAHLTYRSEAELETRFGHAPQPGEDPLHPTGAGRYAVQSYLDHQADKLVRRFDAGSYVVLTDAMNTHDVGRGRGGVTAALGGIRRPVVVAGIDSDRLYPLHQQRRIADEVPTCSGLSIVRSRFGHDGFLLEIGAVSELVEQALYLADA